MRCSEFVLCVLMLSLISRLISQTVTYDHQYYSTEDGLASNDVTCGVQDSGGFIWLGTKNGLQRFDGQLPIKIVYHEV